VANRNGGAESPADTILGVPVYFYRSRAVSGRLLIHFFRGNKIKLKSIKHHAEIKMLN